MLAVNVLNERAREDVEPLATTGARGAIFMPLDVNTEATDRTGCSRVSRRSGAGSISCLHSIAFLAEEELHG